MCPSSRIVVATDEEWTDEAPLAEGLPWAASTVAQLEICRLGTGSWQMSPAWLAEHVRWPRADLVVVPAARPLRNTVAAWAIIELLRDASCPVLVARPSPRTARLLLAMDLSRAILPAVQLDAAAARHRPRLRTTARRETRAVSHLNEARLARLLAAAGLRGDLTVVTARPGHAILGAAEVPGAELLVIGLECTPRFLGSPGDRWAQTIALDAACSVLVVPTTSNGRAAGESCRD